MSYSYHLSQNPNHLNQVTSHHPYHLKYFVLSTVQTFVQYGLKEAQFTSYSHALTEVAAISYLMGMGYDPRIAHRIVESWEVDEVF